MMRSGRYIQIFFCGGAAFVVLLLFPAFSAADDSALMSVSPGERDPNMGLTGSADCTVGLRVIKGSENGSHFKMKSLNAGRFLADVGPQLEPLPYGKYQVLDSVTQNTSVGESVLFKVHDVRRKQHTLQVKPEEVTKERIRVYVNWQGPENTEMLATSLRVVNGKNVVLGTDSDGDESTIMSINVHCKY